MATSYKDYVRNRNNKKKQNSNTNSSSSSSSSSTNKSSKSIEQRSTKEISDAIDKEYESRAWRSSDARVGGRSAQTNAVRQTSKANNEIGRASRLMSELDDYTSGKNYMSAMSAAKKGMALKKRTETSKKELDNIIKGYGSRMSQENRQMLQKMRDALDIYDGSLEDAAKFYTQYSNEKQFTDSKLVSKFEEKYKDADYDTVKTAMNRLGRKAEGPSSKNAKTSEARENVNLLATMKAMFPGLKMEELSDENIKKFGQALRDAEGSLTEKDKYGNEAYREVQWLKSKAEELKTSDIVNKEIEDIENQLYAKPYDPNDKSDRSESANEKRAMYNQELQALKDRINADPNKSQSEKQEEINEGIKQLQRRFGGKDTSVRALEPELENLKGERYILQGKDILADLDKNSDFKEQSQKITEDMPGWLKGTKETIEDYQNPANAVKIGSDVYDGNLALMYITDDERARLRYMWNTQGEKAVIDYVNNYLRYDLNQRFDTAANGIYSEWAKDNPIGMSALSVATNLGSGMAYLDTLGQKAGNALKGEPDKPVDWNRPVMTGTYGFTTNVRDTVANDVIGGGFGGFLYQTVMSMADSGAIMALTAGAGAGMGAISKGAQFALNNAGTMLLGGAAATSAAKQAKEAGASDSQALAIGALEGAAETIFENVSLGNLQSLAGDLSGVTLKKFFMNILKQGMVEGSEEVFTTLANTLSEAVILGDKSSYSQSLQQYLNMGYSQEEADKMATKDWWNQLFQDFMGGFVSGGMFGAGGSFVARSNYNKLGKTIINAESGMPYVESVIANISDETNEAVQFAENLKENPDNIDKSSIGTLMGMVDDYAKTSDQAMDEANKTREVLESSNIIDRMTQGIRDERTAALEQQNNEITLDETAKRSVDIQTGKEQAVQSGSQQSEEYTQKISTNDTAQNNAQKTHDVTVTRNGKAVKLSTRIEVTDTDSIDNSLTMKLSDGTEVSSNDVQFRDKKTQELIAQTKGLVDDGWTVDQIQSFIDNYDGKTDPGRYAAAFKAAAFRASVDNSNDTFKNSLKGFTSDIAMILTGDQIRAAYTVGLQRNDAGIDIRDVETQTKAAVKESAAVAQETQTNIDKAVEAKQNDKGQVKQARRSNFTYEHNVKDSEMNETQKKNAKNLKALEHLSKALGIKIVARDSIDIKTKDGKVIKSGANGKFVRSKGTVYISLDAENPLRVVLSHELTHFIQAYSPSLYEELKSYIRDYMNAKVDSMAFDETVEYYMEKYNLDRNSAIDEVVADACDMFLDSKTFTQEMADEIAKTHRNLAEKIRDFIEKLLKDLASFFSEDFRQSNASAYLQSTLSEENLNALKTMWDKALTNAVRTYNSLSESEMTDLEKNGFEVDEDTQSVSYSAKSYMESDYIAEREKMAKQIADKLGVSQKKAEKWIDDVTGIANTILGEPGRLDYTEEYEGFTSFRPNSEYDHTVDFSLICAKRRLYTGTMNLIRSMIPNAVLLGDDIARIRELMVEKGDEVACGTCYVETSRLNQDKYIADFIREYQLSQRTGKPIEKENSKHERKVLKATKANDYRTFIADPMLNLSVEMFASTDKLNMIRRNHPELALAYDTYMNKLGTSKPKAVETRVAYRHEILDYFTTASRIAKFNGMGGLRINSFSDFETPHLIDMMQVVLDMAKVGLKSHAYTKVPNFAWVFGDTGIKINCSLFGKGTGVDADGNLVFDDVEGMPHDEAFKLRDRYGKNVGTILVGMNEAHIRAALLDPRIDMVIPYHKSQMTDALAARFGLENYTDFTNVQNEVDYKTGSKVDHNINVIFGEATGALDENEMVWDFSKSELENTQAYLDLCEKLDRQPKFPQFLDRKDGKYIATKGYYKMLVDFRIYDNNGIAAPHETVTPNFNMDEANRVLDEYEGGADNLPVDREVAKKFVDEYNESHEDEDVQYSAKYDFTRPFEKQVDDWDNGVFPKRDSLLLGATPAILQQIGLTALPLTLNQTHVSHALRGTKDADHFMGKTILKDLPNLIAHPVAIIESVGNGKSTNSVVVIFSRKYNGHTVIGAIQIDGFGRVNDMDIDSNAITSTFPKKNAITKLLADAVWKESVGQTAVYYYDKKRADALLNAAGVQFPRSFKRDGLINNITDASSPVKKKFATQFDTRQFIHWFDDGVAVDSSGEPLMLITFSNSNGPILMEMNDNGADYGDGVYMTVSGRRFSGMGENKQQVYTNIKKPFDISRGLNHSQATSIAENYGDATTRTISKLKDSSTVIQVLKGFAEEAGLQTSDLLKSVGYDGIHDGDVWVAFNMNQVKTATGGIGLYSEDIEKINYSLKDSPEVTPSSGAWTKGATFDEVKAAHPTLFGLDTDETAQQNTTQVSITKSTYRRIYDIIRDMEGANADNVTILDASSGLGGGTEVGRSEYGFNVDDVEPYPSASYNPRYRDYTAIPGQYDYIISNAVLNVLPQDLRDNLVYTMSTLLKPGGKMFINVRGDDVLNSKGKIAIDADHMEYFIPKNASTGNYQKGFTSAELVAYLQDALGDGYTVEATRKFGKVSVIVTKDQSPLQKFVAESGIQLGETDDAMYSLKDPDTMSNREILAGAFETIAQTDREKKTLKVYQDSVEQLDKIQAQLDADRKEIHSIMFTKGGRAQMGERLAELQNEVKKLERQLNTWDGKLIRLQASKPIRDIVVRARAAEAKKTASKYRERITSIRQTNAARDVRRKLKKLYNDLKKRALKPTENKYIPAPLMETMLSVLETIDFRGGNPDTKIHAQLTDMYMRYEALKNDPDFLTKDAYDEQLSSMLQQLVDTVGETYVRDMSAAQLNETYTILRAIAYTLNQKVKQIGRDTAISNYELGTRAIEEIRTAKGPLSKITKIYNNGSLSPMRFFRMISGWAKNSVLQDLADQLNEGQRKQNDIMMRGYQLFDEFVGTRSARKEFDAFHGKGKNDRILLTNTDGSVLLDTNGKEVYITHDMLVALYLHSMNEDNLRHVLGGKMRIPDIDAYVKGNHSSAYENGHRVQLSEEVLTKLFNENLTEYDKKYAQVVYDFFNTFSKQIINETSMALNGYKKAEVDNYFPIHVDSDFLGAQFDSLIKDGTLEGMGILKQRVNSSKPIYLEGASDAVIRNLNSVAKYGGLAIAVKNFQRVYNVTTIATDEFGEVTDTNNDSVQNALNDKWGKMSKNYIENMLSDLQFGSSGRVGWDSLVNKFFTRARGMFAQATLGMNISVTLKQAASYPTAAAELGWAPLAKALMQSNKKVDLDTLAKYTPIMWIRSHGFVNTELGDAVNPQDWSAKVPALMGWIQAMDIATVTKLALATEYYIRQTQPNLKVGSDEYWTAVAEKFNRVVEFTQPNYSVMQRPEVLRSQNAILRSLTMFMTQRLQNYNILFDAVGEYSAARNSDDVQWQKDASRNLRRAVTSQAVAAAVIAAMTLAVNMLMHRMKRYRDDDDEITAESFSGTFFGDMISTVAGSFLGGSEIYEIINNFTSGTTYDVLDAPNITMVNDLIGAFEKFGQITQKMSKMQQEAEENGETYDASKDTDKLLSQLGEIGTAIAKFFGIPVENGRKLVEGVYYYSLDAANGTLWESDIDKSKSDYYKDMAKALAEGDKDKYQKAHDKALEMIVSDSKYEGSNAKVDAENKIVKGIQSYLVDNDERIRLAAEAMIKANTKEVGRIRKEMIAEGYPEAAVVGAINIMTDKLKKGETEQSNGYVEEYAPDLYETSDIVSAYRAGSEEALEDIIDYFITEKGMSESEARKKVDETARKEIRSGLYNAIDSNDIATAKEYISDLQNHGAENKDIASSLTSTYKDMYLDYYIHSEKSKMSDLEKKLSGLGLTNKEGKNYFDSDKFKSWISKYQEGTKTSEQAEQVKTTSPKEYYETVKKSTSSRKGLITAMSKKYHPLWEDYYLHDDTENLKKLEDQLRSLNITDTYGRNHYDDSLFEYWREQVNK